MDGGGGTGARGSRVKYAYQRPIFLQLFTEDEIQATADHSVRPIIVPRYEQFNLVFHSTYLINSLTFNYNREKCKLRLRNIAPIYIFGWMDSLIPNLHSFRDIGILPWFSGYAEAINAGKSARNEDQVNCSGECLI